MEELFEELDSEHLLNSFRIDMSPPRGQGCDTPRSCSDVITPRSDVTTPRYYVTTHHSDINTPSYISPSTTPSDIQYSSPQETDLPAYLPVPPLYHHPSIENFSDDDISLPPIPSVFNSEAELTDYEDFPGHFGRFLAPSLQLELSIAQEFEEEYKNCETERDIELSLNLSRDLGGIEADKELPANHSPRKDQPKMFETDSKCNQTLAIPFRLVQFLPYEQSDRESWDGFIECEGNTVGVQVDMRHTEPNARQELNLLDKEMQRNASIIDSVVYAL